MGNSYGGIRVLKNGECSCHFQLLGQLASINMKEGDIKYSEDNGKESQTWEVTYNVEGLPWTLSMTKTTKRNSEEELEINIKDTIHRGKNKINPNPNHEYIEHLQRTVRRAKAGLVRDGFGLSAAGVVTASSGVLMDTHFSWYGSETRKGLLVEESEKKRENEKPYMLTLAHYYVNTNKGKKLHTSKIEIDIGLSVVVKIRVLDNGNLDFTVDGPVQHPSSALFYMFEEISRTGMWKPTMCPHCANIQKQHRWQSESEDSDKVPTTLTLGSQQKVRNNGVFVGDANGGIFDRNIMFFVRKFFY